MSWYCDLLTGGLSNLDTLRHPCSPRLQRLRPGFGQHSRLVERGRDPVRKKRKDGHGNENDQIADEGAPMQLYHASNAFYVLALGLSNASVSWLLVRINSSRAPLVTRSLKAIMAFLVLWTIAMVFVMLLACPTGNLAALSTDRCPNWVG